MGLLLRLALPIRRDVRYQPLLEGDLLHFPRRWFTKNISERCNLKNSSTSWGSSNMALTHHQSSLAITITPARKMVT
jgi:hypothetical protein